ncbi:hypothetical protein ACN47E_009980 [Coniothyrium glycines]
MLAIQSGKPQKCTPNLLPARIHHNGPINDVQRYWKPETDRSGMHHAYLRGRHLHGTCLQLPENYVGAVLNVTDKQLPQSSKSEQHRTDEEADGDEDSTEEPTVDVNVAEQVAEFDEIMLWCHGGATDPSQDVYTRSMTEWVAFAESMHVDEQQATTVAQTKT